ncbi:2'-5' RNA ligase family protein [Nocardioides sp. 1609]|uniref:2'-5' RNA ligase family protein n=1 Tax=Nocardioides sp. 1609 TaxID=2508327 RepID=UPI00106FE49D|nr:2'-5' RNA ligase family protein [Nocardioides sp. 1609]
MPRLHALELVPDAAGDAAVRADWQRLRDAGLPSMLDHRGTTNAPHVTVVAVPAIADPDEARAVDLLGALLPLTVRASGLALLGGVQVTVARLLDVDDAVVRAVLDLRASMATSPERHRGWLPHVSLARRVPRERTQEVVDALGPGEVALTLTTLRRWDPEAGTVRTLAAAH